MLKPHEEHYNAFIPVHGEIEDVAIIKDFQKDFRIKVELYQQRWRTPKEYIELYKRVIELIEIEFINK